MKSFKKRKSQEYKEKLMVMRKKSKYKSGDKLDVTHNPARLSLPFILQILHPSFKEDTGEQCFGARAFKNMLAAATWLWNNTLHFLCHATSTHSACPPNLKLVPFP